MDDTVWFQIVALFGKMFRYSVLFLVFTVFTSIKNFFCNFLSNPPKNPSRRAGGTKPNFLGGLLMRLRTFDIMTILKICCIRHIDKDHRLIVELPGELRG